MEQPPRVPRVSELINEDASERGTLFGYSWRDRVGIVRGFCITTTVADGETFVAKVENLSDVAVTNRQCVHANGHIHYFLLLSNEHVVQLDVYSTAETETRAPGKRYTPTTVTPARIHALRFRTNERVSEWFGSCDGTLTQLKAAEDDCIQALYGLIVSMECSQLGVVFVPQAFALAHAEAAMSLAVTKLSTVTRCSDAADLSFRTECGAPRAVVMRVDSCCIRDITVVSPMQYEAFSALDASHDCFSDHWFVLAKDERIDAVGFVTKGDRFIAMAFRTNYRTSMWFGSSSADDVTWLDCSDHPGSFICGFLVEGYGTTECTQVTGVAAIYKCQEAATCGSTDTKKAVDAVGRASTAA